MKYLAKVCTSALTLGFLAVAGSATASANQNGAQNQSHHNQNDNQQSTKVVNPNQNTYPLYQGTTHHFHKIHKITRTPQTNVNRRSHVMRNGAQSNDYNDNDVNAAGNTYYYRGNMYNTKDSYRAARFAHSKMARLANTKLGDPYVWGATGANAFDCSGFTQYLYRNAKHIQLPRTAQAQYNAEKHVAYKHIKPGNLVFFGYSPSSISHVGMYIGNGKMIDAQNRGVIVENVKAPWWNLVGCARVRRNVNLSLD